MFQIVINESLKLFNRMEFLTIILQVIMSLVIGLLELNEFLSLFKYFVIVAVTHVQLLVLNTLTLFR